MGAGRAVVTSYGCGVRGYSSPSHATFVALQTTSMEEATNDMKSMLEVEEKVAAIIERENMSKEAVISYRMVFAFMDLDNGGTIEQTELRFGLDSCGSHYGPQELEMMFEEVDNDKSGEIDFSEFLQFMLNLRQHKIESVSDEAVTGGSEGDNDSAEVPHSTQQRQVGPGVHHDECEVGNRRGTGSADDASNGERGVYKEVEETDDQNVEEKEVEEAAERPTGQQNEP